LTRGGRDDVVEVLGASGCLKIELTQGSPIRAFSLDGLRFAIEKADTTVGWSRPAVDDLHELGFEGQMAHFVDCIRTGTPPKPGARGEDGLAVLQIALAAAESASQGRRIAW
jgi:predicted dehydrogenase